MNLPLNGFHQDREMKPVSYSVGQGDGLEQNPAEEWPDWSSRGGTEGSGGGQSVQIHIQASAGGDPLSRRLELSKADLEEEPWDDFEDPEPTSDLSPTTPLSDRDIPPPAREGATVPVRKAPVTLKPGSSRPLKLTSAPRESTQSRVPSSWDDSWAQEESSTVDIKAGAPQKKTGSAGLGEEFTIKVKKKGQMDPELDLFADMEPDIKLSSGTLYSPSLQVPSALNKFAATNLTEASSKQVCGDHLQAFHVVRPVFNSLSDICMFLSVLKTKSKYIKPDPFSPSFFLWRRKQTAGLLTMTWAGGMRTPGDALRHTEQKTTPTHVLQTFLYCYAAGNDGIRLFYSILLMKNQILLKWERKKLCRCWNVETWSHFFPH